jgi:hypothetical protein
MTDCEDSESVDQERTVAILKILSSTPAPRLQALGH